MYEVIVAMIGIDATTIGLIYGFLRNFKTDVDARFEKMDKKIEKIDSRLEGWMKHSIAIRAEQAKRTDQLYQMFIDLLKEKK